MRSLKASGYSRGMTIFMAISSFLVSSIVSLEWTPRAAAQTLVNEFMCVLYGSNQVKTPGDPMAWGRANLTLDFSTGSVWFAFQIRSSGFPTGASINFGSSTQAGPQVVSLLLPRIPVTSPGVGTYFFQGAVPMDGGLMNTILSSPSTYYVLVTNSFYPDGAMRSQLEYPDSGFRISYADSGQYNS